MTHMQRTLAALSGAMLLLTGCSSAPQQLSTSAPESAEMTESTRPAEDVTVTVAVSNQNDKALLDAVSRFNALDCGYQVELRDYSAYIDKSMSYEDDLGGGETVTVITDDSALDPVALRVQMDVMNGEVDLVPDSAFVANLGRYEVLVQKGAFADLYPFMEHDTEINTDTLDTHVLSLHETDGELRCLPLYYTIETAFGDPALVGTRENWTFDEMLDCWENAPAGTTFYGVSTRDYVYMNLLRGCLGDFVDYETASCSFDSPLFVRMLEFCNTFPSPLGYKADPDHTHDLFHSTTIYGVSSFGETAEGRTLVGYPTEDRTGAFLNAAYNRWGIVRNTSPEKQAGAWAFLRTLAAEEAQQSRLPGEDGAQEDGVFYGENGFPINKAAAEHYAEGLIAKDEQNVPNPQTAQGVAYDAGWLSREEYDRCMAYIQGINRLSTNIDSSLQAIVEEELRRMYADEQTPQETAEKIQSRASIMVSERS